MKKVKLDLDTLSVTSFGTDAAPEQARGTVLGRGYAPPPETHTCETAQASCQYSACANIYNTCGYSCDCVTSTANDVFCH